MIINISPSVNSRVALNSTFMIISDVEFDESTVNTTNITFMQDTLNIPFSVFYVAASKTLTINPDSDLEINLFYSITLTPGIEVVGVPITEEKVRFVTSSVDQSQIIEIASSTNNLDVINKNFLIDQLLDLEYILKHGDKFNFSYNETIFNPLTEKYSISDNVVDIQVQDQLMDSLQKTLLSDFTQYLENIKENSIRTTAEFQLLKNKLLKLAFQINNATGIKKTIHYLFKLYAEMLGYHFIEIQPDPKDFFKYHISTDLPRKYWIEILSTILHPFSFSVVYNEIIQLVESVQLDNMFRTNKRLFGVNALQTEGNDGLVLINESLLETNIDLSSFKIDEFNNYHLHILNGTNKGIYRIKHSSIFKDSKNTITIHETFSASESAVIFEIYKIPLSLTNDFGITFTEDDEELNNRFKLALLNETGIFPTTVIENIFGDNYVSKHNYGDFLRFLYYINFVNKQPFDYLQSSRLGEGSESVVSKLQYNLLSNHLEFLLSNNETTTIFNSGDIILERNLDITEPYLQMHSSGNWLSIDLIFGNTIMYLDNTNTVLPNNDIETGLLIDSFEAVFGVGSYQEGWQKITLTDPIVIQGENTLQPTNKIIISGATNEENNGILNVIDVDYGNNVIYVDNVGGVFESSSPAVFSYSSLFRISPILFGLPSIFSFDGNLLNGYGKFFDMHVVDVLDANSHNSFLFRYAEYLAIINNELMDGTYFDSLEMGIVHWNTATIEYKLINDNDLNFEANYNIELYEFDVLDEVGTGLQVGHMYYGDDKRFVIHLLDPHIIETNKYYSINPYVALTEESHRGDEFEVVKSFDRMVKMIYPNLTESIFSVEQDSSPITIDYPYLESNGLLLFMESGSTYDVELNIQQVSNLTITTLGILEFVHNGEANDILTRTTGSWIADGFTSNSKINISDIESINYGEYLIETVTATDLILESTETIISENGDYLEINNTITGLETSNHIYQKPSMIGL